MNASICLFQLFRKIKIAGSYEDKALLALRKLRHRLSFVSLHPFLEAMVWSESLISIIFLKPNRFWLQKKWGKKYRLTSERNVRKNAHNNKIIINTIYMKPCFPIIKKKFSENCNVNAPQKRKISDMLEQIGAQRLWC